MIANIRHGAPLGIAVLLFAACAPATRGGSGAGQTPAPAVRTINDADVEFMSGMIPHHAQAVLIAGWAESHGARRDVLVICQRIVVGQKDEIGLMQRWLAERGVDVPAADATTHKMKMGDMVHEMLMPGTLNAEQLAELDKSRGSDFDRLLLKAMIGHHLGAIEMVNKLHASAGSGNDDIVYRFSSDVYADQSTEVERMTKMLEATPGK